jgi:hypothetical protein
MTASAREQTHTSKDLMEQEMSILRSYWAATSAKGDGSLPPLPGAGKSPKSGKIGRSVSTGNLPGYQKPLRPATSTDSFLNDRLIDGPLPIPMLEAALTNRSTAVCQLDRGGETDPDADASRRVRVKDASTGGVIPLCFVISGGVPGGRISWMVTTLPRSGAADVGSFAEDDFALGSSSSPSFSSFDTVGEKITAGEGVRAPAREAAGVAFGGTKDWRAL